jgi:hypothetical protein
LGRLDYKKGARFGSDAETNRVNHGMAGFADVFGDFIAYYRYDPSATVIDPIYDEAIGSGRIYYPAIRVPCLHVTHVQGQNEYGDIGFYNNDSLSAIASFDQFSAVGMPWSDIETGNYLKDRVYYNRQVYRVVKISPRGKIQERSITIEIECQQLKPDELYDDATFAPWNTP